MTIHCASEICDREASAALTCPRLPRRTPLCCACLADVLAYAGDYLRQPGRVVVENLPDGAA